MKCKQAQTMFTEYLDGMVSGSSARELSLHLENCAACHAEFETLLGTQQLVASLGREQAPADLALRLRVALSREAAQGRRDWAQAFLVRVENALDTLLVPATAGLAAAILLFGLLIGFFAVPEQLEGANNDVSLQVYTPPRLASSPFDVKLGPGNPDSLVVETEIDAQGRVQDYRILSAPAHAERLLPQLNNMLLFSTFRPATAFGRPTPGRVVLAFSRISVKG